MFHGAKASLNRDGIVLVQQDRDFLDVLRREPDADLAGLRLPVGSDGIEAVSGDRK